MLRCAVVRLSADENDPGYAAWMAIPNRFEVTIFLDGVEQRSVVTADDEDGFVVKSKLDAQGNVQVNPEKPDEIWMEMLHGAVRIEVPA
jgi:hypothetical protein